MNRIYEYAPEQGKEAVELNIRRPISFSVGGGQRGDTTLTKTITTSSKNGRAGHLNTLDSFRKLHEFIFKQLKQYSAFVWVRFRF